LFEVKLGFSFEKEDSLSLFSSMAGLVKEPAATFYLADGLPRLIALDWFIPKLPESAWVLKGVTDCCCNICDRIYLI
jgi:hypothetical protein